MMVPAEDIVLNSQCSDPEKAERLCCVIRRSDNEVKKAMRSGFYERIDLPAAQPYYSDGREKEKEIKGIDGDNWVDTRRTLLEFHVHYELPAPFDDPDYGIADPYIITIDRSTGKVLSIYRNWEDGDDARLPIQYFVHYQYMPGLGCYGLGLIHLLGNITKASTAILRLLLDSGTLATLPAGFKTKGLRVVGQNDPLKPGEFRDVEVMAGALRDNLMQLPFNEPSAVLAALLDTMVEEGRRVGSIADVDISGASENAPVGTTLALLERSLKVMTAVHARLHASLRRELKLIGRVIHNEMPEIYDWDLKGEFNRKIDFDGRGGYHSGIRSERRNAGAENCTTSGG